MIRIQPSADQYCWTFGGRASLMTVRPGELLEIFTEDAFGGRIQSVDHFASERVEYPYLNPQTGPFHVEGAEPGDTLAIHIVTVTPARDWGVSTTLPLFGALVGTRQTANLQPNLPERTWIYQVDVERGEVVYQAGDSDYTTRFELTPFLGTIGVAPSGGEVRSTLVPDMFGGNMDAPEVRAGTTVYLGVNEPGALFSIGDGHYRQGDGEACGVAVEGAMNTVLTVDVLKRTTCEWPRFETDESLMVAGSARPLEDAFRIAQTQLIRWISEASGLSLMDSYQVVSQGSHSAIANVCDPNYTVVTQMPKRHLPSAVDWMEGAHERLKAIA
jgi:acetamidase/formamidase